MARPFDILLPIETAYAREVLFALELLDSVSLARVVQGAKVTAVGLTGEPIINGAGVFVWLKEPTASFQKLVIEPGTLPFERLEIPAAQVVLKKLHTAELKPKPNYPFTPGITAIRGSLYEHKVPLGQTPVPVRNATVRLEWKDSLGFQPGTGTSTTNDAGDFAAILRFAPDEEPQLVTGTQELTVRLFAKRGGGAERFQDLNPNPLQGRVTDGVFAWDELQP